MALLGGLAVAASGLALTSVTAADPGGGNGQGNGQGDGAATATPIKHLVVIFDENVSFDHYFATYPYATNPSGEPQFTASPDTPTVNNLVNQSSPTGPTGPLLTNNPNRSNPLRLDHGDPLTCDQGHGYTPEQSAADHGAEDMFAQDTGGNVTLNNCLKSGEPVPTGGSSNYAVMDYYDGNTVTALWNYAQHFSMSDNAWTTTFGPSTPGALNATSAQTYGAICGQSTSTINDSPCTAPAGLSSPVTSSNITTPTGQPVAGTGTVYGDPDPTYDICTYLPSSDGGDNRTPSATLTMGGNNIGEELSNAGRSWGWFEGGFDDGYVPGQGTQPTTAQICSEQHNNVGGSPVTDYIPHHEPFQYYASTANPMHVPPTSVAMVGHNDQANHQYDIADFWAAANSGNMPDVSYLKAPAYQDGHAGTTYSDPLDEQSWLVNTINGLEALPTWKSTAVVITYDDSDGWYDHVLGPILTGSQTSLDTLTGTNQCGSNVPQNSTGGAEQARCGVGTRVPFVVVSRYAGRNKVSDSLIDQSSIVKFIESNWSLAPMGDGASDNAAGSLDSLFNFGGPPAPPLTLDPNTGEPVSN